MSELPKHLSNLPVARADVVVTDSQSLFDVWREDILPATVIKFEDFPNPTKAIGIIFDDDPDTLILARPGTGEMQETRNPFVPSPTCVSLVPIPDYRVAGMYEPFSYKPFDLNRLR